MFLSNSQNFSNSTLQKDKFIQNQSEQNKLLQTLICRNFKEEKGRRMQNLGQNLEVIQKFLTSQCTQKYMKRFQERNHINLQNKDLKQLATFILMRTLLPNHLSLQLVTTLYIYKLMTQLIKEMMMKERFTFIIFLEKIKKIKTG